MSWYRASNIKTAAPAAYAPQRATHKNIADYYPPDRAMRFFSYLKKHGRSIGFHHGTNAAYYGLMLEAGKILAQKAVAHKVTVPEGKSDEGVSGEVKKHIYLFTKNKTGTDGSSYSHRAERSGVAGAISLELDVPIYQISEVRKAIFNPAMNKGGRSIDDHNEGANCNTMRQLIVPILSGKSPANIEVTENGKTTTKQILLKNRADEVAIFKHLVSVLAENIPKNPYEFTSWMTLDLRHIKEIVFPNSHAIYSATHCKTLTQLKKELESATPETAEKMKKKVITHLENYPGDLSVIGSSIDEKGKVVFDPKYYENPDYVKPAVAGWAKAIKQNTKTLEFLPSVYLTDKSVFDKSGDLLSHQKESKLLNELKAPIKDFVLGNTCTECKGTGKIGNEVCGNCKGEKRIGGTLHNLTKKIMNANSIGSLYSTISEVPYALYNYPEVGSALKTKIIQMGAQDPTTALTVVKLIPSGVLNTHEFVDAFLDNVIGKSGTTTQYWNNLPTFMKNIPHIAEKYITSVDPLTINYEQFSESIIQKNKDQLIKNMTVKIENDLYSSLQHGAGIPETLWNTEPVANALVKKTLEFVSGYNGLSNTFGYWSKYPQLAKDNPQFKQSIINELLKPENENNFNLLTKIPEDYKNLPELSLKYQKACIQSGKISGLDWETLQPELKEVYLQTVINKLKQAPYEYSSFKSMLKMPEIINAIGEGYIEYAKNGNGAAWPPEFSELPEFQPYKKKIQAQNLMAGGWTSMTYDTLDNDLKAAWLTAASHAVSTNPEYYGYYIPESLKKHPDILQGLAKGYCAKIKNGYYSKVPEAIMNMPEFEPYKLDVQKAQITPNNVFSLKYKDLVEILKPTYLETMSGVLKKYPDKYGYINDEAVKLDPSIIKTMGEAYLQKANNYGSVYINEFLLKLPEFKPYLLPIYKVKITNDDLTQIDVNELDPETQKIYKSKVIQNLETYPDGYTSLPEEWKTDLEAVKATVAGFKYKIQQMDVSKVPQEFLDAPQFAPYKQELESLEKTYWVKMLSDTGNKVWRYVSDMPDKFSKDPDIIKTLTESLKSCNYGEYYDFKTMPQQVENGLKSKFEPDVVQMLMQSAKIGITAVLKPYMASNNTGYWEYLPTEYIQSNKKEMLEELVKDVDEKSVNQLGGSLATIKKLFPDAQAEMEIIKKKLGADLLTTIISYKNNDYYKNQYCNMAAQYGIVTPEISEACKPNIETYLNKIEGTKFTTTKAKYYAQIAPFYPNDPKILEIKDELTLKYVKKIKLAVTPQEKENIYNEAVAYGLDEPKLKLALEGKKQPKKVVPKTIFPPKEAPPVEPVAPVQPEPAANIPDPFSVAIVNKINQMTGTLHDKAAACTKALKQNPQSNELLALKQTLKAQYQTLLSNATTPKSKAETCHYCKVYLGENIC